MSANKATRHCFALIVGQGGRSILAETTEMMGAEDLLAAGAVNAQVARKIYSIVDRMERLVLECGEDIRGSQPTGDNILGVLTTIEKESVGAILKAGEATIVAVVEFAEAPGPCRWAVHHGYARLGESITGIAAGGAQVLSTGGGHRINHPLMTTIRVTSNRIAAQKMRDTVELDVSKIFEGTSVEEAGERIYNEVLKTASGKVTRCEILTENNAFAIHRVGVSL
jgi:altronate dehydratase large subunit